MVKRSNGGKLIKPVWSSRSTPQKLIRWIQQQATYRRLINRYCLATNKCFLHIIQFSETVPAYMQPFLIFIHLSSTQALIMHPLPVPLLLTLLQLAVLTYVSGGAYYGHQQRPQQYQPMQHMQHMGMGKEGFPQQQYHRKEVPYMQYPHYRKELPQMPVHKGKGKETGRKGGTYDGGSDKGTGDMRICFNLHLSIEFIECLNSFPF